MKCAPAPTEKEFKMLFGLKKYKIVKDFNGYKAGQIVAFNGADADRYADKICSLQVAKPIEPVVQETKAVVVEDGIKSTEKKVKRTRRSKK